MRGHIHEYKPTNRRRAISDKEYQLIRSFDIQRCDCGHEVFWETTTFPRWKYDAIYNPNPVSESGDIWLSDLKPIDWDKYNKN